MLVLDVSAAGVTCVVKLNDVPIFSEHAIEPVQQAAKIDNWALPHLNQLAVGIGKLPARAAPQTAEKPLPAPRAKVVLRITSPGAAAEEDKILAAYEWTHGAAPPPYVATAMEQSVNLGARQEWLWASAVRVPEPKPADRSEIVSVIKELASALSAGDRQRIRELQRVAITENAISLGQSPEDVFGDYEDFLAERIEAGMRVSPILETQLEFLSAGNGRLVHVVAPDGRPAISSDSRAGYFGIDPWFAKIGHKWTLVR